MKRFHVHVAVKDLYASIRFYSSLFGVQPVVEKEDYAKWMLDDPSLNFAISARGNQPGVNHLGFQVDSDTELKEIKANLISAQAPILEQNETSCCYAKSDKYWITDPQGIAWESFHTLSTIPVFDGDSKPSPSDNKVAVPCCVPSR